MTGWRAPGGSRRARWRGRLSLAWHWSLARAQYAPQRTAVSVGGVALSIALMLVVTGLALGIAGGTTVYGDDVDYWIVPEAGGDSSALIQTGGPQFGDVHTVQASLEEHEDVTYATPVLLEVIRLTGPTGADAYVLVVGVVGADGMGDVAGVPTDALTPGDPYYDDGSYEGSWTGEAVLSPAAAALLDASVGSDLTPYAAPDSDFTVVEVGSADVQAGMGDLPVALVQLSELQELTGATTYDQADQFLVGTDSPAVESYLEGIYPHSSVLTRTDLTTQQLIEDELPLALSLTALIVAVVIGTLFVMTTMGLEVTADATHLATMLALGFSTTARTAVVSLRTLLVTIIGGVFGVVIGRGGIELANYGALRTITSMPVATFHPSFVAYGVGVSFLIGVLSIPYLVVLVRRGDEAGWVSE